MIFLGCKILKAYFNNINIVQTYGPVCIKTGRSI